MITRDKGEFIYHITHFWHFTNPPPILLNCHFQVTPIQKLSLFATFLVLCSNIFWVVLLFSSIYVHRSRILWVISLIVVPPPPSYSLFTLGAKPPPALLVSDMIYECSLLGRILPKSLGKSTRHWVPFFIAKMRDTSIINWKYEHNDIQSLTTVLRKRYIASGRCCGNARLINLVIKDKICIEKQC